MYGILISALYTALTFVVRTVFVKFIIFSGLFFVASEFVRYLVTKLPGIASINQAMSAIPPGIWYFCDLFQFAVGLKLILAAYVTRFAIRRIPVIG
jgi:hypothetical protein